MEIKLPSFILQKMDLTNDKHLQLIRKFDNDELVKRYLYTYRDSFYDLVASAIESQGMFNSFYVVYHDDKIIGYIEIENPINTYLNYAILREERQKGYATLLLKELSEYLLAFDYEKSVNTIIRRENKNSIGASKNSGFIYVDDNDDKFDTYRKSK